MACLVIYLFDKVVFAYYLSLRIDFATKTATMESPLILITVRHISNGLSIAKIRAKPMASLSAGMPIDSNTITSITMPAPGTAAEPIEANRAVRTIVSCAVKSRGMCSAWAMNTAATA